MSLSQTWIRQPAVAGTFYTNNAEKLRSQLLGFLPATEKVSRPIAVMAPHAGYRYSGSAAGEIYRRVQVPALAIVLCPNHTGRGPRISVWEQGEWRTPLGAVPVDHEAAQAFLKTCSAAKSDTTAHQHEHAIEVQIPFLQTRNPDVKILPIVLGPLSAADCEEVGRCLAAIVTERGPGETLLVASTDMSHYISAKEARKKDRLALDQFEKLDARGLYETVTENDISMCGFIPTTSVVAAARLLKATRAEVVKYTHSGEVTGDDSSVVGYAAGLTLP